MKWRHYASLECFWKDLILLYQTSSENPDYTISTKFEIQKSLGRRGLLHCRRLLHWNSFITLYSQPQMNLHTKSCTRSSKTTFILSNLTNLMQYCAVKYGWHGLQDVVDTSWRRRWSSICIPQNPLFWAFIPSSTTVFLCAAPRASLLPVISDMFLNLL